MQNHSFTEDVFKSIKPGIPTKKQSEVKAELDEIQKKHQALSGQQFKEAFLKDAQPIIETYSRLNLNQELATIRMVLYIFLGLTFISLAIGMMSMGGN